MKPALLASVFAVAAVRWAGPGGSSVGIIAMGLFVSGCCNGDVLCVGAVNVQFGRTVTLPYRVEASSLQDSLLASTDCAQAAALRIVLSRGRNDADGESSIGTPTQDDHA